jgi:hypothetical protein
MEKQVNDLQQQLNYYKSQGKIFLDVSKEQIKSINTFLINSITEDDLVKMLNYVCHNPLKNMDIIHALQKRALGISNDYVFDDEPSGITKDLRKH